MRVDEVNGIGHRDVGTTPPPPGQPNHRPLTVALFLVMLLAGEIGALRARGSAKFPDALGAPWTIPSRLHAPLLSGAVLLGGLALSFSIVPGLRRWIAIPIFGTLLAGIGAAARVYPPYQLLVWQLHAAEVPRSDVALLHGWFAGSLVMIGGSWLVASAWRRRNHRTLSASHGSAKWGSPDSLVQDRGVVLGCDRQRTLRFNGEGHVLTVAPTRSGKGVSCVIPNLLDHPGSALVTDPKGENYAVTARWRRGQGQSVHALDPFDVVDGLAAFNPVDLVDVNSVDAVDDARMLADMIVLSEGKEGDQVFWNEEARGVLTGLILHAASSRQPELRTLTHVRTLLTLPPDSFRELLNEMRDNKAAGGLVARAAARLAQKAERERSGVISTAQSHTHFLDSPRMARVLGRSTFHFDELKRDVATVYLILPTDRIDSYARWLRLMIGCGLLAVTRTPGQPSDRILFLLDEFAHLRRMHPVQRDIGLAGGFGVRFWLVLQDLAQLRSIYSDTWPTFLANVDVLQAFGTNDWETAEYLSKMTGESTIHVATENQSTGVSRGRSSQRQQGSSWSKAETGRRLLFPDEVRRLPRDQQLLFIKGAAPLLAGRVSYLQDKTLAQRSDSNPLYAPVRG